MTLLVIAASVGCGGGGHAPGGSPPGGEGDAGTPEEDSGTPPPEPDSGVDAGADASVDPCDVDADGFRAIACDGDDCDDAAPDVNPGVVEYEEWWTEEVDEITSDPGTSIAVDSDGAAHLAYALPYEGELRYATNASGTWVIDVVDSDADREWLPSIALYAGAVQMTYLDRTDGAVVWATNASGDWETENVDPMAWDACAPGDPGSYHSSLAVADDGTAHVVFADLCNYVRYATRSPEGEWSGEQIGNTERGWGPVELDAEGALHLLSNPYQAGIVYSVRDDDGWTDETTGISGVDESFALTGDGPVTCFRASLSLVECARREGAEGWSAEAVDPPVVSSERHTFTGVDVDGEGMMHVVYQWRNISCPSGECSGPTSMNLATETDDGWTVESLDAATLPDQTGLDPAIAVDAADRVHVVWRRYDAGASAIDNETTLHYATISADDDVDNDCDGIVR